MRKYKKEFEKWFDEYFCDQQGEDSPYNYADVLEAFKAGINSKTSSNEEIKKLRESNEKYQSGFVDDNLEIQKLKQQLRELEVKKHLSKVCSNIKCNFYDNKMKDNCSFDNMKECKDYKPS